MQRRTIIGLILIIIGLSALTGFSFIRFIIAVIFILIGIRIIARRGNWGDWDKTEQTVSNEDFINEVVIFGPLKKAVKSENFKGGSIVAIFGGGEIDLSQAKTTEKSIDMEFVAVFGGGKLIVPKNWRVNSQGVAVFGGYDNRVSPEGEVATTLNLKGSAVFGGVEIIN